MPACEAAAAPRSGTARPQPASSGVDLLHRSTVLRAQSAGALAVRLGSAPELDLANAATTSRRHSSLSAGRIGRRRSRSRAPPARWRRPAVPTAAASAAASSTSTATVTASSTGRRRGHRRRNAPAKTQPVRCRGTECPRTHRRRRTGTNIRCATAAPVMPSRLHEHDQHEDHRAAPSSTCRRGLARRSHRPPRANRRARPGPRGRCRPPRESGRARPSASIPRRAAPAAARAPAPASAATAAAGSTAVSRVVLSIAADDQSRSAVCAAAGKTTLPICQAKFVSGANASVNASE